MALYSCPECGHDVSSSADRCPNCGWKVPGNKMQETGKAMQSCGTTMTIFITLPILLICILLGF